MAPSPPAGAPLAGMEHLFGMMTVQDEDRNITVTPGPSNPLIPDRVKCAVEFEVRESSTRRRLFVKEAVEEGGLICASKPLLNIIEDDDAVKSTCDNCLATKVDEMSTRHRATSIYPQQLVEDAAVKLMACGHCKTLYYCSKKCQKQGWKHHHKFECETFVKLRALRADFLQKKKCRFVIRLLECRAHAVLSVSEWSEILALPTNRESKMAMDPFAKVALAVAQVAKEIVETEVTEDGIIDLFCMMHNTQRGISIPIIKGRRVHDPKMPSECIVGVCLEPFLSSMAHACIPSATTVHEGAEICVRAARDLAAGDELTLCYIPNVRDYQTRKETLRKFWGIDCSCALCEKGDLGPQGALRDQVHRLLAVDMIAHPHSLSEVERGIKNMLEAGFGWGAYPMRDLHQQLLRGNFARMNAAECVKIALKIRYQIEPAQKNPPASIASRLATLYVLQSFLDFPPPGTTVLGDLPAKVRGLAIPVLFNLRDLIAWDYARCYGADSMVAVFEKSLARRQASAFNARLQGSWRQKRFGYVPLHQSEAARVRFVTNMNGLLVWAGLDILDAKDLL